MFSSPFLALPTRRANDLICIEDGTKAVVMATPEGILLKPVTWHAISRLRRILKRGLASKLFTESMNFVDPWVIATC